jgi:hypothetical protein
MSETRKVEWDFSKPVLDQVCEHVQGMMDENAKTRAKMMKALDDLGRYKPGYKERQEAYKAAGVSCFDRERFDPTVIIEYNNKRRINDV